MKHLKYLVVALGLLFFAPIEPAHAIGCGTGAGTCFGIATGNWSNGASWSDNSGGSTCSSTCTVGPISGDAVILDSGTNTKTITINSAAGAGTLTTTCTCTLAISNAVTLTVSGNTFNLGSGLTFTRALGSQAVLFTSTTGTSGSPTAITVSNSANVFGNVTFNGSGGYFQLQTAITGLNSATVTVTNGTFDTNGFAASFGFWSIAAGGTLTPKASTITANGLSGGVWSLTGTLSSNTATLNIVPSTTTTGGRSFAGGGSTNYNIVNLQGSSGISSVGINLSVSGSNTFATLGVTGTGPILLTAATTNTITSALTITGTSALPLFFQSTSTSAVSTIAAPASSTAIWTGFENITFTGNAMVASNCLNAGGNTLLTCNPSSGGDGIIGGGL